MGDTGQTESAQAGSQALRSLCPWEGKQKNAEQQRLSEAERGLGTLPWNSK